MAKALGIAGSAVSIASFGLQICDGLLGYHRDWKSYQSDISGTCDKLSSLEDTFRLLKQTLDEPCTEPNRATRVQECLMSCKRSVEGLENDFEQGRSFRENCRDAR